MRSQPDDRLICLTRQGRDLAFAEIVRRYRPGLVALASGFAPAGQAEDVVQESLVRSWKALRASNAEIRLKPWLCTIVRNRALNARRDARPHEPLDETIDGVPQPPEIVLGAEELDRVVAAVKALPRAQREALVQCAVEGRAHEQVAAALSTSTGAVRQLVYRARITLRNGCGLLVPLPILAALSAGGSGPAAGGAVAVAGAAGGAGGGTLALKGVAAVAIGALAVGGGLAIERSAQHRAPNADAEAGPVPARTHEAGSKQLAGTGPGSNAGSSNPGGDPGQASGAGEGQGGDAAAGDPADDPADSAAGGRSGGGGDGGDGEDGQAPGPNAPEGSNPGSPPAHGDDHAEVEDSPQGGHPASVEGYEDEPPEHQHIEHEEASGPGSDEQDSELADAYPDEPDLDEADEPPAD